MLHKLTTADKLILKSTYSIVDGIAAMFGKHVEVVLHSLDSDNPSIIKIANGHVTGRGIGAPITNLALEKLKTDSDVSTPYFTRTEKGELLRSVTSMIRNEDGTPIALLCINSNLDVPMNSFFMDLFPQTNQLTASPETFAKDSIEMLTDSIAKIQHDVFEDESIAVSRRVRTIVERLHHQGAFNIKDAIQITANILNVSKDSVYRYLRKFK
ncbi:helix-turn-helix transcriptional regulator [Aliivibrio fischeri]|uniref:Uncharacterized protein n=2 Tax=Aliivibrio fischeri TaxID=668 RepID=A0A1B9PL94_ALIFS|nr:MULTISPECIES: PAS domain-containing protein [Aliivibrio]ACH66172.1 YheO domain protein [Aliivibrio fischeri MJ11]MBD1568396.1 hypothetical protein [Aliivibrio sp. S10_S31]MBP3141197.1 PAS domain-containing protein [Aliivibrio fischeri]MBP3155506.1 PAS domain-containing protein [Aliivibrio fischeri]MCE7566780.1 PAS domain-containing protein [Aliivibrio fischeri]